MWSRFYLHNVAGNFVFGKSTHQLAEFVVFLGELEHRCPASSGVSWIT